MYRITVVLVSICLSSVVGTIYRLNATEYSRMPPLSELDNYEVCMEQPQAIYCVIKLNLYAKHDHPLMHTIREYSMDVNRHYNHTNVDRGVCVKTSCWQFLAGKDLTNDRQLDEVLQQCMDDKFQRQYGLNTRLVFKFNCDRAGETDEITFADWSFLIFAVLLVLTVIGATLYDQYLKTYNINDQGNQYILSFSVFRNMNKLLSVHEDETTKHLRAFHAARTVLNLLTLTMHVVYVVASGFQRNPHNIEKSYENAIAYIFYNGLVIVQIFFFISGFLLANSIKIYSETRTLTWKQTFIFMIKRFLRLTPALGMIIWFTSTWIRHVGSGPLWKTYIHNLMVADCHKYWWSHLLYVNNYMRANRHCVIQAWHVATDTQLHFMALVVLMATVKGGRKSTMIALLLLGTLAPAVHVWLTDLDGMALVTPEIYRSSIGDSVFHIHFAGHNNLQNYLIGMAVGMFFYNCQRTGKHISLTKHFSNHKFLYGIGHLLTIPAYAYFFYLCHVFYEESTPLLTRVLFAAIQRLIMAAITTWVILGFVFRAPGIMTSAAESRIWVVPSRLTYAVYLVHMIIVYALLGSRQYTSDIGIFMLVVLYSGVVLMSYVLALVLHLVVEAPFNEITKLMMTPQKKKVDTTKYVNGNGESFKEK